MISKTYASKILNMLTGASSTNILEDPSVVHLGLCANEPDATNGSLANAAEPTSVASYERKIVGGSDQTVTRLFGSSANSGVVKNSKEIQMKTAREAYPNKMNYWFLSAGPTGNAYIWGRIKHILGEKTTVEGFTLNSDNTTYSASITFEDIFELQDSVAYIVSFDDKEYETIAYTHESSIALGNHLEAGDDDKKPPFTIVYNNETGEATIQTLKEDASHVVAIYGIGIDIKKSTVPTFYENELQASIDV
jgi:hypothetical protein